MKNPIFSIKRVAFTLITAYLVIKVMIVGKFILIPFVFGLLLMIILKPLASAIERLVRVRALSIILAFLVIFLPIIGLFTVFGFQVANVFENMPNITERLRDGLEQVLIWVNDTFGISRSRSRELIEQNLDQLSETPMRFLSSAFSGLTGMIGGFFLTILFTFFFLWYRTGFKNFVLQQFGSQSRAEASELIVQIQNTIQRYIFGLMAVIVLLACLNSLGLWLLGIKYALLWGCLAACLVVIPYIGTTLGGTLPFLYALATPGPWWQPLAIVGLYWGIQIIEGNFITPNVVGSSVRVNPFLAILALIIGGVIWGIAGIVLAIPLLGIVRVIMDHLDRFKPVGHLIGDELHQKEGKFLEEWDDDRYRLFHYFREEENSD